MKDRIERGFGVWGHFAYRHAWLVIALMLAISAGLTSQLSRLAIDTSTEGFLHEGDPIRIKYEKFRRQFGRDDLILLAVRAPHVFDLAFLDRLRRLHEDIENEVPKLEDVTSLVNVRETRGEEDRLIVGEFLESWPATGAELAHLERRALANPLYVDMLISRNARMTALVIETDAYSSIGMETDELAGFDDDLPGRPRDSEPRPFITGEENHEIVDAVKRVVDRYQSPDFQIYMAGAPTMTDRLTTVMQRDTIRFTAFAFCAIVAFLLFLFRRVAGVVLPLVVVGLSVLCTLAVMAMMGRPLTLPTQILPSFLLAVGVGNSVHILAIFLQRRRRGEDKETSIAFAFAHSALAILMTSLTTAGGLISFVWAEMAPISDFGLFGAVGVLMALAFTIILLPSLIAVFPMREENLTGDSEHRGSQRALVSVGVLAARHPGPVITFTVVLLMLALAGALRLRFSHDPIKWFPAEDYVRKSVDVINAEFGGSLYLELLFDTRVENGIQDPAILRRIEELAGFAGSLDVRGISVTKTVSLVDIVKEIHAALNENRPAFRIIPEDRTLVAQELLLFESSGTDDLEDFVDSQFRFGRVTMRFPHADAIYYPEFIRELESGIERIFGDRVEYSVTGLIALVGKTIGALIRSMATSYVIALMVITPLMVLLIGNLRVGLISMFPNLTPIIIMLGLMGVFDVPLDAFTLLVGSIAIGLAVDNTIHFMHNYRRYFDQSGDAIEAVAATLASTGQALLYTALVLSTGFFIYAFSSLSSLFYFGLLTGFTILMAFLVNWTLAPAMVAVLARRQQAAAPAVRTIEAG